MHAPSIKIIIAKVYCLVNLYPGPSSYLLTLQPTRSLVSQFNSHQQQSRPLCMALSIFIRQRLRAEASSPGPLHQSSIPCCTTAIVIMTRMTHALICCLERGTANGLKAM